MEFTVAVLTELLETFWTLYGLEENAATKLALLLVADLDEGTHIGHFEGARQQSDRVFW